MLWYDYFMFYLAVVFSHCIITFIYKKFNSKELMINREYVFIILFASLLSAINGLFNYTVSKVMIHFIILSVMNMVIFKEEIKKTIYSTLVIYLLVTIVEVVCSPLFILLPVDNAKDLDDNMILKVAFTILVMGLTYLIFKIKNLNKLLLKIASFLNNSNYTFSVMVCVGLIVFFSLSTFKTALNYTSIVNLLLNVLLIIIFIVTIIILVRQKLKIDKITKEQENLMGFLSKYEEVIDKNRINRHEMLNNLLTLKTFPRKSSKEYIDIIDKFIESYNIKNPQRVKNLYNLPSGLKGMMFYKLNDIDKKSIVLTSNISAASIHAIDHLDSKVYVKICKIVGILLDNAIEASEKSKEKVIVLEFYKEKDNIVFYLENSFKGKVDLNLINAQHYSSKGKNRGYGLYVVYKLINKTKELEIVQEVNKKHFITTLIIETKINKNKKRV